MPNSGTGTRRVADRFTRPTTQREDEADPQGSGAASTKESVSSTTLPVSWEAEYSFPSSVGSPFVLQGFTRGSARSPVHGKLRLQSSHGTVHRSSGGADLVAESPVSGQWIQRQAQMMIQSNASLLGWGGGGGGGQYATM